MFKKPNNLLILLTMVLPVQMLYGQVVSINGAVFSTTSGTVVNIDTVHTDNSGILDNDGTVTLASIINAGTVQGTGTYNIRNLFTNTGTFNCETSTVHFNGPIAQD